MINREISSFLQEASSVCNNGICVNGTSTRDKKIITYDLENLIFEKPCKIQIADMDIDKALETISVLVESHACEDSFEMAKRLKCPPLRNYIGLRNSCSALNGVFYECDN